jgi:hypothetical protein
MSGLDQSSPWAPACPISAGNPYCRPRVCPLALAAARPDRTRSRSTSRSNSAKEKISATISFPEQVEAPPPTDKAEVRQTNVTPADQKPLARRRGAPKSSTQETVVTSIHMPKRTLALLRSVAIRRARRQGGRPSVSAIITELVEKHRKDLEKERSRTSAKRKPN